MPRHLLNPMDFSVEELDQLMDLAADIEHNPAKYAHACEGKKLATCFYERLLLLVSMNQVHVHD